MTRLLERYPSRSSILPAATAVMPCRVLAPFVARIDPAMPNPQIAATRLTADLPFRWGLTVTPGYLFADLPQGNYLIHLPLLAFTEQPT